MINIPKKFYYVWIGNKEKPEIFYQCYESWGKIMPEFEIIEINETNFDIDYYYKNNKFFKECWDRKLWAYISDYIRLVVLYKNGGYFLDTDMEIIKKFTKIENLDKKEIDFFTTFESDDGIGMGLFGAKKESKLLGRMLKFYKKDIWEKPVFTIPQIIREILVKEYNYDISKSEIIDERNKIYILKKEYFYPFLPHEKWNKSMLKENNYAIHWWNHSWKGKKPFLFLKTKHLKGCKKIIKKIGIYLQIFRDFVRNKK